MAFSTFVSTRSQAVSEMEKRKYQAIREFLLQMGLAVNNILPLNPNEFSRNHKVKFRQLMSRNALTIEDNRHGATIIWLEQIMPDESRSLNKVFSWDQPRYIFKIEGSDVPGQKTLKVEVEICSWSVFE